MAGWILRVLFIAPVLLALSGCGGATRTFDCGSDVIDISVTDDVISPKSIHVERLGRCYFKVTNNGADRHALAIEIASKGPWRQTRPLAPGESEILWGFFHDAGEYSLWDPIEGNGQQGMKATVKVSCLRVEVPSTSRRCKDNAHSTR